MDKQNIIVVAYQQHTSHDLNLPEQLSSMAKERNWKVNQQKKTH